MKVRNGFVSNSSSSSFLICIKKGEELSQENVLKTFEIGENSPLYNMASELAGYLAENVGQITMDTIKNDYTWKGEIEDYGIKLLELIQDGWDVYKGYASNEGGSIEAYLCDVDLNIKTDNLIIEKEGGY